MQQFNFNKNFNGFRQNLNLSENHRSILLGARKDIRRAIRTAFNEQESKYFTDESINILREFTKNSNNSAKPKPLFMSQGSFVYHTINLPYNPPTQQMDLDDGVYLPLSYVENDLHENFDKAALVLRNVIQACIEDLCVENGWSLEKHPKCLRVTISSDAHIDLPIYSIPDDQAHTIKEAALTQHQLHLTQDKATTILSYEKASQILLATENGWVKSDPREIQEWVEETSERFKNKFCFYSRYLKAWRDAEWPNEETKLSSIMIMAGIEKALRESTFYHNENIALDLSAVVNSIKIYLLDSGIKHPRDNCRLDENLPGRHTITERLTNLANQLNKATKLNDVRLLTSVFGDRFPSFDGMSDGEFSQTNLVASTVLTPIRPARL